MTMSRRRTRLTVTLTAVALASLLVGGTSLARSEFSSVRAATARFHSLAAADAFNYGPFPAGVPLHECISNLNGPGAMGIHWVNGQLLDGVLDPTRPEVLVYAPDADGKLHLAALEYVIFQADWFADPAHAGTMPMLFGQPLMVGDNARFQIPPFFALHVWLYQDNPSGTFASFNPNVSCDAATASAGPSTAGAANAPARLASAADARRFACGVAARA
jgi:hypothetical protein